VSLPPEPFTLRIVFSSLDLVRGIATAVGEVGRRSASIVWSNIRPEHGGSCNRREDGPVQRRENRWSASGTASCRPSWTGERPRPADGIRLTTRVSGRFVASRSPRTRQDSPALNLPTACDQTLGSEARGGWRCMQASRHFAVHGRLASVRAGIPPVTDLPRTEHIGHITGASPKRPRNTENRPNLFQSRDDGMEMAIRIHVEELLRGCCLRL
jgi:hypothetical protein